MVHCCPKGMTCGQGGLCRGASMTDVIPAVKKRPAIPTDKVVCPDKTQCPKGNTCCLVRKGAYACCPAPDVSHLRE